MTKRETTAAGRLAALALALALASVGPAIAQAASGDSISIPPAAEQAAQAITRDTLRAPIRFLADDLLEGRGPASRGDQLARLYLATSLESMGYARRPRRRLPAALRHRRHRRASSPDLGLPAGRPHGLPRRLRRLGRRQRRAADRGGPRRRRARLRRLRHPGPRVRLGRLQGRGPARQGPGHAQQRPRLGPEPRSQGDGPRSTTAAGPTSTRAPRARAPPGRSSSTRPRRPAIRWQVVQTSWSGQQFSSPPGASRASRWTAWVTEDAASKLAGLAGKDLDELSSGAQRGLPARAAGDHHVAAPDQQGRRGRRRPMSAACCAGSDPALADQVVVYTAHHDHLGVGDRSRPATASTTAPATTPPASRQVLAIARAYTRLPERAAAVDPGPLRRRRGTGPPGLGSTSPTHPTSCLRGRSQPTSTTTAANIWGETRDLTFIGLGKSSASTTSSRQSPRDQGAGVAATSSPTAASSTAPTSSTSPRSACRRSTSTPAPTSSAVRRAGASSRSSDYEATQLPPAERRARRRLELRRHDPGRALRLLGRLVVADKPQLPTWNPGDEFEAAREKALAEVAQGAGR